MKEDKVTDEQVRGVTWRVDKLTSRRVNRLCVKEDKVTDEQVRGVTEYRDRDKVCLRQDNVAS